MMAQTYRRIILTPSSSSAAARADLEKKLLAAFELQQRLSRESPHILRPFGSPVLAELTFHFDHEPAVPIDFKHFFDRDTGGIGTDELLAAAYALADALRVAHGMSGGGGAIHGGLAPGALLRTKDGIWKVADFRIAPSICEALGIEQYLNLAIGPRKADEAGVTVTGAWEVLLEQEYERDDRICAFIDPEKYAAVLDHGERVLATFEPGSDVIAAGNLIALLAQRIHPFLSDVPEAHRIVEMSRMMASAVAIPLQRADLLAAPESEVKAFAEKLVKMLERQPKNRPRAAEVVEILSPTQTLKRDYAALARSQDEGEAEHWLATLEPLLERKEWLALETTLNAAPTLKIWPDGVTKRVEEFRKQLREFGEAERQGAQKEADAALATSWFNLFQSAVQNKKWEEGRALLQKKPKLHFCPADVVQAAGPLEKSLVVELKQIDDHAAARKWFTEVTQWVDREDWLAADKLLNEKPTLEHWPEDVTKPIAEIQRKLTERLGAIHGSHQQAKKWLEQAKQALRSKAYGQAIEILGDKPDLPHWPDGVLDDAGRLIDECAERIGDDAALKLKLRDESVQRAARVFLKASVEKDMGGLLDAGVIQLEIDGDQVAIDEGMDRGQALIVLSLPTSAESKAAPEIRIPFEYDLSEKTQAVQDAEGLVRQKIIAELMTRIAARQSMGPLELNAKLKKGLYPQASLVVLLKEPVKHATAKARLDPADKEAFDVHLTWDAQRLAWFLTDAAELNRRLAARTIESAREAVMAQCLQNAAGLAPYAQGLDIEVEAPAIEANPLTSVASFTAKLSFGHPSDDRRFPLQQVKGEIGAGGHIDLFGNWSEALAAFEKILVAEQTSRRDAAVEFIGAAASKDGAKAKVSVVPKRIKSPTDQITIEVKLKGEADQIHTGQWNPAKFDFEFPSGHQAPAKALPPKPPAAVKQPAPPAVAKEKEKEKPKEPAPTKKTEKPKEPETSPPKPPGKSRKGMFIGGGIAAVVLIGAIIAYTMSGNGKKPDPVVENPPEPPTTLSFDPVSLFNELDTEFTAAFVKLNKQLDGNEPGEVEVVFSTPWHTDTPNTAIHTARLQLGNSPFDARVTLLYDTVAKSWGSAKWEFINEPPLAQISGWLRSNAARKVQALSKDGKQTEAEALHAELAPIFETLKAKGLCDSLAPLDATVATEVPRDPPVTVPEYPISEVLGTENAGLAKLIQAVVEAGKRDEMNVRPEFSADPWDVSKPDSSTRSAAIRLKDYPELQVQCTFDYVEATAAYAGSPNWTLLTPVPEQVSLARQLIANGEKRIMQLSTTGKLNLARTQLEQLSAAVTQIRGNAAFVELPTLTVGVPPAWNKIQPAGYSVVEAAGVDEQTGYPKQIKEDADGRLMLLVSLSPVDPQWDKLGRPSEGRDWFILYADANEWAVDQEGAEANRRGTPFNDYSAAEKAAADALVRIPTREQWNTAAMVLAANAVPEAANWFDGLYEWCSDPVDTTANGATSHWVTGGCYINTKQNIPPAPAGSDVGQRLNWLKDPLVTQPRVHGDDLVGLRTVMSFYPLAKS